MKIKKILLNNRKKTFEIYAEKDYYEYPYSQLHLLHTEQNLISETFIDKELDREGFICRLKSGKEVTIHLDQVLEYNKDPEYLRQMLLYKLTLKAQKLLKEKKVSKREIIRHLNTSPTQFYRLMDQTFYHKTIDQMVKLLNALDCLVELEFKKVA